MSRVGPASVSERRPTRNVLRLEAQPNLILLEPQDSSLKPRMVGRRSDTAARMSELVPPYN
jgi:hypothetical protein